MTSHSPSPAPRASRLDRLRHAGPGSRVSLTLAARYVARHVRDFFLTVNFNKLHCMITSSDSPSLN